MFTVEFDVSDELEGLLRRAADASVIGQGGAKAPTAQEYALVKCRRCLDDEGATVRLTDKQERAKKLEAADEAKLAAIDNILR